MKVRIALVINEHGQWSSGGHYKQTDEQAMSIAVEMLDEVGSAERQYFIEAEVPLPKAETIQGEAVP